MSQRRPFEGYLLRDHGSSGSPRHPSSPSSEPEHVVRAWLTLTLRHQLCPSDNLRSVGSLGLGSASKGRGLRNALGQRLTLDSSFISCPLFKPVSWASVFPRPCTLLIYLRGTLIVFSLQYLVFFICDLRNVKRKNADT